MTPCSLLRRLGAIIYDWFLLISIIFIAWLPVPLIPSDYPLWLTLGFRWCYLLSIIFLYFAWSWRKGGQTLGMKAWQIYLIHRADSSQPSTITWALCAKRWFFAAISVALGGYGFLMALFRKDKLALHDLASRTQLIHAPRSATRKKPPSTAD